MRPTEQIIRPTEHATPASASMPDLQSSSPPSFSHHRPPPDGAPVRLPMGRASASPWGACPPPEGAPVRLLAPVRPHVERLSA